eukprot:IDg6290t1
MENDGLSFLSFKDGEDINDDEEATAFMMATGQLINLNLRDPDNRFHGANLEFYA